MIIMMTISLEVVSRLAVAYKEVRSGRTTNLVNCIVNALQDIAHAALRMQSERILSLMSYSLSAL
jgi:hypothetical protein